MKKALAAATGRAGNNVRQLKCSFGRAVAKPEATGKRAPGDNNTSWSAGFVSVQTDSALQFTSAWTGSVCVEYGKPLSGQVPAIVVQIESNTE
jgi:hypothetical protein